MNEISELNKSLNDIYYGCIHSSNICEQCKFNSIMGNLETIQHKLHSLFSLLKEIKDEQKITRNNSIS